MRVVGAFGTVAWYRAGMVDTRTPAQRHSDAVALHAIEENPFDASDFAMFAMFERKGWSTEQCRAYILKQARKKRVLAAE